MPSLKDIRRRISSIKNTQKITRAMKLVSAAKFARANSAVVSARPYAHAFDEMHKRLIAEIGDKVSSPLMDERPEGRALIAILSTDRGFCGSLNSNLFKTVSGFVQGKKSSNIDVDVVAWGKRARLFAQKNKLKVIEAREKVLDKPSYDMARQVASDLTQKFLSGEYDRVYVAFVEFRSALSQSPKVIQLLPLVKPSLAASEGEATESRTGVLIEPSAQLLVDGLFKRAVASTLFRLLLEGAASEHGARMTAMDSATNNASEVLRKMNIQYARARQAAITKELIEITSGAQAL
jgi:F-type H+-transporting ATPase subunit gamma